MACEVGFRVVMTPCVANDWLCVSIILHSDNGIGPEGATALAPELGKLVKLTKLYLQGVCSNVCGVCAL